MASNNDKLVECLMRIEQSENAKILPKHTPTYRWMVEATNRILEIEHALAIRSNDG